MKHSRGFTLIEIIVTLCVMVVLMAVAIVALRSTQANARDQERKFDAESIARGLEIRYEQGNPKATQPAGWTAKGQYPGTNEMQHIEGVDLGTSWTPPQIANGYLTAALPGTTDSVFRSPGNNANSTNDFDMWCTSSCTNYTTTLSSTMNSINSFTTTSKYTYSPVDRSGNICCCGDCVKYFLYYRTEVDGALQTIKSKRQ